MAFENISTEELLKRREELLQSKKSIQPTLKRGEMNSEMKGNDLSRISTGELIQRRDELKKQKPKIVGGILGAGLKGVQSEFEEKTAGVAQLIQQVGLAPVESGLRRAGFEGVADFIKQTRERGAEKITTQVKERREKRRAELPEKERKFETAGKILANIAQTGFLAPATGAGSAIEGAVEGATMPAETVEERAKNIAKTSAISALTFGLVKGAGETLGAAKKGTKSILANKFYDDFSTTISGLKNKASSVYKAMREVNADIGDVASQRIVNNLDETLIKSGKLNRKLHGDTLSVISDFKKDIAQNAKVSLEGLDQYRQLFNQVVMKNTDVAGNINPDGQKAILLIKKIDSLVENLKPSDLSQGGAKATELLNLARQDWKVYKKFQKITNVLGKAGGDPNRIKAGFKRFVSKEKNLVGFTDLEKIALKRVASNTSGEKILKQLGKFGIDFGTSLTPGNTFLPVASFFASSLTGAPTKGAGIVAVGTVARQTQRLLAKGKVNEALKIIEAGGLTDVVNIVNKAPTESAKKELLTKLISLGIVRGTNEIKGEE